MKPILIYLSTSSILVSTSKGLIRLNCPFTVVCITEDLEEIKMDEKLEVTSVHSTSNEPLLYEILDKKYAYYLFMIYK